MPARRPTATDWPAAPASAVLVQLYRHAMLAITHDMVGIASAMELRLDVLPAGGAADTDALRTLTNQLRDVSRMTRLLKGPDADDALMPGRMLHAADWFRLTARLASAIVPRGTRVEPTIDDLSIAPRSAHLLCVLWLLACEELSLAAVRRPTIRLSVRSHAHHGQIDVEATVADAEWPERNGRVSRWQRYASRLAAGPHVQLDWWTRDDALMRWRCSVADGVTTPAPEVARTTVR